MSEEEIKNQISHFSAKCTEIVKVEELAVKKEQYNKNRTNEEFDSHLNEIEAELQIDKCKLTKLNKKKR